MKRGEELLSANYIGKPMIRALFERKNFKECSFLLGQGPVLHCGAFGCSEKRNFEKQINHLLCGQCRQCYLQAEVK